jgi:beta-lactam-binding protein with PASTA domain
MEDEEAGEIRAEVTVTGDVSGQLAVGSNIVQMRVDRVLGNVVTVLPPGATPNVAPRPHPLRLVPRPPTAVFDRVDETAAAVAELAAHRSVALQASPGMGKSTLVHHLAHHPGVAAAYGAVVCLSARGQSRDDLLQALFEAFYTSDVPVRPTRVQLRHYLQPLHAAVLLDDVDLPDDAVTELQELAPSCGFALAGTRAGPWAGARALPLTGLPVDATGQLLAHVFGHDLHPTDQGAVYALWGLTRGAPARLVQLGVTATTYPGPLESFIQWAANEGLPPFRVDTPEDRLLLGLLAAVPGVELTAQQLAEISGLPDAAWRLRQWADRGVLTVTAAGAFGFVGGGELDPTEWQLEDRRAQLVNHVAAWARLHPGTVLVAGGSAEPVRVLQETARRRRDWRAVIALGLLLDVALALGGRWDAWRAGLASTLEAARALGDQATEAMALHQLGSGALCRGDLAAARDLLEAALDLRLALGHTAAAEVTRQNLATITAPPVPVVAGDGGGAGWFANVPTAAKVAAVLVPLLGSLAFVGLGYARDTPQTSFAPERLAFTGQATGQASAPQFMQLNNTGSGELHVDDVVVSGPDHGAFTLVDTSCVRPVPAGGSCTAAVVFTPATPGAQQASLSWRVRELSGELVAPLVGSGVAAAPSAPTADPDVLVFATQPPGTLSAPQQVRLVAGAAPLRVKAATTQGVQSADFLVDGDGCAGALLPSGGSCTVSVRFTPRAAGERGALLTVADAAGQPAATVGLRGVGSTPPSPSAAPTSAVVRPVLPELAPSVVAFGEHPLDTESAAQTVTVTNRAEGPLRLTGIAVDDAGKAFRVDGAACADVTLPAGGSCRIAVRFAPGRAGPFTGVLSAGVQGLTGRSTTTLTGTAIVPGVEVPGLVGRPQAEAAARVDALGLHVGQVERRPDPSIAADEVVACTPRPGTLVPPGSAVDLVVSTGPEQVAVPPVVGAPEATARSMITDRKLGVGDVATEPSDTVPAGSVIRSKPAPGELVAPGTKVALAVSSGPAPVEMPAVVGLPVQQASALLEAAGLLERSDFVDAQGNPQPDGTVEASDPAPGQAVPEGERIRLTVTPPETGGAG